MLVIHVIVSILLMVVILLQDGKGGDVVSALGGGGSQSVFGGAGAAPFLTKATVFLTVVFAITSLSLAVLKTRERKSILQSVNPKVAVEETKVQNPEKKSGIVKEGEKGDQEGKVEVKANNGDVTAKPSEKTENQTMKATEKKDSNSKK